MAKKSATIPLLASKVKDYMTKINPSTISHLTKIRSIITSSSSTNTEKAMTLLIGDITWYHGCHQWYLKMYPHVVSSMITDIISRKLWNISLSKYTSFEDVYFDMELWFKRSYISQVTLYDITFRLLYARNEPRLYPKDCVYIHAKAEKGYRDLLLKKYPLPPIKGYNHRICITEFTKTFGSLESYWIEDMLCAIGKGIIKV